MKQVGKFRKEAFLEIIADDPMGDVVEDFREGYPGNFFRSFCKKRTKGTGAVADDDGLGGGDILIVF
ncbi:MAG: hypothetical protein H5U09_04690 [Desulfomicrobiaceae bacterium]|nr:hypothetical protein [Desulfomicrobiaceae bacterium]